jgi:hypothetical protein
MLARNNKDETTTGTQEVHLLNTEKERGKRNHSTCRRQVIKDVCELESTVSHVKSRSNN